MSSAGSSSASPTRASKVWHRTRVGGSLALAVGLLLYGATYPFGPYLVLVSCTLMGLGAIVEAEHMRLLGTQAQGQRGGLWFGSLAVVGVALALLWQLDLSRGTGMQTLDIQGYCRAVLVSIAAVAAPALVGMASGALDRRSPMRLLANYLWVALPLPSLILVLAQWGVAGLGALLLLSKVGDIAGYYVGNGLGSRFPHHPFPKLSPGKTTVGCLGSLLVGSLAGPLVTELGWLPATRWGVWGALFAAAVVNLAAQAGDLLESGAKRRAGVKDSGTLFGPSGGFLDLVDSLLLTVPAALILWPLFVLVP